MSRTISQSYASGITLTNAGDNPVYVTGTINYGTGTALYGTSGTSWTLDNSGLISGIVGVLLAAGGTLTNAGTISGSGGTAVAFGSGASRLILDPGAVLNGTVVSNASYSNTLELAHGTATGTLSYLSSQFTGFNTVTIDAGASWLWPAPTFLGPPIGDTITNGVTLKNAGTLSGYFDVLAGGTVTNQSGGSIIAQPSGIALLDGGTLINDASIVNPTIAYGYSGIYLKNNGYLYNAATGTISAGTNVVQLSRAGTLINAGLITAKYKTGTAVWVYEHATVTNIGTISASGKSGAGVVLSYNGEFTNNGLVTASGANGYGLSMFGNQYIPTAVNNGTISASGTSATGVVNANGVLTNAATGLISGGRFGAHDSTYGSQPAPTLINYGRITSSSTATSSKSIGAGVYTGGGGALTNKSSGIISAPITAVHGVNSPLFNQGTIWGTGTAGLGVELTGGTLDNAGTIIGNSGTAVVLDGSGTNRLIVEPGARFLNSAGSAGIVRGTKGTSVLELATGSMAGTLSGLATQFVNFATVLVDAGATWTLSGSVAASASLINNGHIDADITLAAGAYASNAATGTIVGSGTAAIRGGSGARVVNAGVIDPATYGVYLPNGGSVTNVAGGVIEGTQTGVKIAGSAGTVSNQGTIAGDSELGAGASLLQGGTVVNGIAGTTVSSALIYGAGYGVAVTGAAGTVTNYGTIATALCGCGPQIGVDLQSGGSVINAQFASISGYAYGVRIGATATSATISNAGLIEASGTIGKAVYFANSGNDRLVVDPGASFIGTVDGGTAASTLELAHGAGVGTLAAFSTQFSGFNQIAVDNSAGWILDALVNPGSVNLGFGSTLDVQQTVVAGETITFVAGNGELQLGDPGGFSGTITGFLRGETIDLTSVSYDIANTVSLLPGNTLEVIANGSTFDLQLDPSQDYSTYRFRLSPDNGGSGPGTDITDYNLACFVAGTRIRTARGDVAVEALHAGDTVLTHDGRMRSVRWIGYRHLDLTRHKAPKRAQPVRIRANALADGVPARDLLLSPDHAVLLDGLLVPARLLVNGASIARESTWRSVTYYHVELDAHDVLLAEGLPAESYLDTGNRGMFENGGEALVLHPDFTVAMPRRETGSCAPFADDAARVEPVWRALQQRALQCGFPSPPCIETTSDPELRVAVGDRLIAPISVDSTRHVFALPWSDGVVRLVSRTAAPCDAKPWLADDRRLGVMVFGLALRCGAVTQDIPLDHPTLTQGWSSVERDATGSIWRWTLGDALLPLPDPGPVLLEVTLARELRYRCAA